MRPYRKPRFQVWVLEEEANRRAGTFIFGMYSECSQEVHALIDTARMYQDRTWFPEPALEAYIRAGAVLRLTE